MRLNRKIELLEPQITITEDGQKLPGFLSKGLVSASLNPKQGSEQYEGYLTVSQNRALWMIRYRPDITATWKLNHNGKKYDILNIIEDRRLFSLVLICEFKNNG